MDNETNQYWPLTIFIVTIKYVNITYIIRPQRINNGHHTEDTNERESKRITLASYQFSSIFYAFLSVYVCVCEPYSSKNEKHIYCWFSNRLSRVSRLELLLCSEKKLFLFGVWNGFVWLLYILPMTFITVAQCECREQIWFLVHTLKSLNLECNSNLFIRSNKQCKKKHRGNQNTLGDVAVGDINLCISLIVCWPQFRTLFYVHYKMMRQFTILTDVKCDLLMKWCKLAEQFIACRRDNATKKNKKSPQLFVRNEIK